MKAAYRHESHTRFGFEFREVHKIITVVGNTGSPFRRIRLKISRQSVKLETASADVKSHDPADKDTDIEINCSFDYYVHSLHIARLHVMSYVISQVHILSDLLQNTYCLNTIILKPMSHPTC